MTRLATSSPAPEAADRPRFPPDPAVYRHQFRTEGYTVLPGFFSTEEMAGLTAEIQAAGTRTGTQDVLDRGELKFYPNAFARSAAIQRFIAQQRLVDLLVPLVGPGVWVRWDQAVAKGPGAGEFPWHQDNAYSQVRDPHCQLWIALTRMTPQNGGLWLAPRSHRRGSLPHRTAGNHVVFDGQVEDERFIAAEAGDVVLFSSRTLHATKPNTSDETRWAYVVEYISTRHWDPLAKPPFFVAAEGGRSVGAWRDHYAGQRNPWSRGKYVWPALRARIAGWLRRGAGAKSHEAGQPGAPRHAPERPPVRVRPASR